MSSRKELKAQKKQERLAQEQAAREQEAKNRRMRALGMIIAATTITVIAIVIIAGANSSNQTQPKPLAGTPNGAVDVKTMLQGIPQQGQTLGNPKAPWHMVEFADLKCPVCKMFDVQVMPSVIERYVRSGKLKVDLKLLHFVGENAPDGTPGLTPGDSPAAAHFAVATQQQNRYWNFAELFYFNQQDEAIRYAGTPDFLRWISKGSGVDWSKAVKQQNSSWVNQTLAGYQREFDQAGGDGTPTVLVGRSGGKLEKIDFKPIGFDNRDGFMAFIKERTKKTPSFRRDEFLRRRIA